MLPVVELRGALPLGVSLGLPHLTAYFVAVVGNLVPVPFIILFARSIFKWLKKHVPFLRRIVVRLEWRARSKRSYIDKWSLLGLFLLVAIPLPGTGAWTGALVAALFDIRLKRAMPVIAAGVLAAGLIVLAITFGVSHIIN
ncbi:MAG: small multi-drug export protein [Oscillospiraceae bacterium]|nr:small multi-drug export protein [Oscillospiraceae bacterium]